MRRYGYHPDDQHPDHGDGDSWERALALHHRLCARERAALARRAASSSANGSGESRSAFSDLLDAHRRRVLPEVSGRQIDLFKRLGL